jgi:hypothetical protein
VAGRHPGSLRRDRRLWWRLLPLLTLPACGDPPVLEVGRIGYGAAEVAGLDATGRQALANLTAFGLVTADGRTGELLEPFLQRDERSLQLQQVALELAAPALGLDDDGLREHYRREPEQELVIRHLVVLSERWREPAHRDSAAARAAEALDRAQAGEPFEAVVAEYSDEPGAAARGGRLPPGRRGSWVPEFWLAATGLRVGELSGVVETEYGFHVLRLEARDTVPFEEVRDRVLRGRVPLPEALARSAAWAAEQTRDLRVDTSAVAAWQRGEPPTSPLAFWPDGRFPPLHAGDLDRHVVTLPPESAADLLAAPTAGVAALLVSLAGTHAVMARGQALGVQVPADQRAALEAQWTERVAAWATVLGFAPAQSDGRVRQTALAAVAGTRQDVLQARAEVERLGLALRRLYPVTGE